MIEKKYGEVELRIFDTRSEMGKAAAKEAGEVIRSMLAKKDEINCIFAAAPSQNEFLEALIEEPGIDWKRVNAYHMDEYVGLGLDDKPAFSRFLTNMIFSKLPFKTVNLINGKACNAEDEAERYSNLLKSIKVDITFMGIGENGHIAFNDPAFADFHDKKIVKIVELDDVCRMQQVHDGCFPAFDDVPKRAMTVTIPELISATKIFCIVPTDKKADAVKKSLEGPVTENCPASILRTVPKVSMYVDAAAASLLNL